jgi:HSP20 family protein
VPDDGRTQTLPRRAEPRLRFRAASSKEEATVVYPHPFDTLSALQQTLDAFRASNWLTSGMSGAGGYPPMNIFRKDDDFIVITELPGVKRSDITVQVKGRTIRVAGSKSISYPEKAALHRRERRVGRFDRAVTLPVEIDADGVKAECRDGILALFLPRAPADKPKSIQVT